MPAARAAASISLPPGCPGASPSGRLLMTRVMPVVLASARSAGAICPATKVFSSSFLNMPASCGRNSDGVLIGAASRGCNGGTGGRSEENPPELQSLMRLSYAVLCLKITNHTDEDLHTNHN